MQRIDANAARILQSVEQNGVCVEKEVHGYFVAGVKNLCLTLNF